MKKAHHFGQSDDQRSASDHEHLRRFLEIEETVYALAYETRILAGASDNMLGGCSSDGNKISGNEAEALRYAINRLEDLSGELLRGYVGKRRAHVVDDARLAQD